MMPDLINRTTTEISQYGYFVNGAWCETDLGTFDDLDPYSGEVFARVARCGREETETAIAAAAKAFPAWSETRPTERAQLLRKAQEIVSQRRDELVRVLAQETGAASFNAGFQIHLIEELLTQVIGWAYLPTGEVLQSDAPDTTQTVVRQPLGVVVSITPWNGAALLAWRAVLSPLIAGNTVVVKPSELAPLSAGLLVADILNEAGFPPGVVNVVTHGPGEAKPVADAVFDSPEVRCINFIGSVPTGKMLAERAGRTMKRSVMELGGYNPLLVLDDADLDYAVRIAAFSAFFHQGQICLNARKILVHRSLYSDFVERLVAKAEALPIGDPQDSTTFIGPLITASAVENVDARVREAEHSGARVLTGGTYQGPFYRPTVLVDVPDDAAITCEETFGPVVVVQPFDSDDEAIDIANRPLYGLSSAVLGADVHRATRVGSRLKTGTVHINMPTIDDEIGVPIGGVRDSGWGRTGPYAIHDFTDLIAVTVQHGQRQLPMI